MTPTPHFDVLGFGAVAVDDLLYVDAYPRADQKVRVRHRQRQCGGLTGTALVAAARLGARTAYVGVLGDDPLSREVAQIFEREGIELDYSVRRPDARPAHSTIVVDEARKTRTIFSSVDGLIGADPALPEADLIRAASVLLIDHHGLEGTLRAVRIARAGGVGVVADFERDPGPPFAELLGLADHLIVSERFARQLTGQSDAAEAARALSTSDRKAVMVTCGASGCWYLGGTGQGLQGDNRLARASCLCTAETPVADSRVPRASCPCTGETPMAPGDSGLARASGPGTGETPVAPECDEPRHCPAFPVEVLDTTGCGDVFHGAYAAALAEGQDLPARVAFASAVAALKATCRGGQAGIPSRGMVDEFLLK